MKSHLLKLLTFILSFFKTTPEPKVTIRHQFNTLQKQAEDLENIAFWFSCNPNACSSEIAVQLDNASSRMAALTSAVLIKIRADDEQTQIERLKARIK